MSSDTTRRYFVQFLGLLFVSLFSGYCSGTDPVPWFSGFTSEVKCPINGEHFIDAKIVLDMTGVDKTAWVKSIAIASAVPVDLVRVLYADCGPDNISDFYCDANDGDVYNITFHQYAKQPFSGDLFRAIINDATLFFNIHTPWEYYPMTQDGALQTLTIGNETKKFYNSSLDFILDGERPDFLDVTYNVSGIDWTTYSVSILGPDDTVYASSTTDTVISTDKVPGDSEWIYVSYKAANGDDNVCEHKAKVQLTETTITTTTTTTIAETTTIAGTSTGVRTPSETIDTRTHSTNPTSRESRPTKLTPTTTTPTTTAPGPSCCKLKWYYIVLIVIIGIILLAIGICILVWWWKCRNAHGVDCDVNTRMHQLEDLVKQNPKVKKHIETCPNVPVQFFHKSSKEENQQVDRQRKVVDLLTVQEKKDVGDKARIDMRWTLIETTVLNVHIKSIRKGPQQNGTPDLEMNLKENEKDNDASPRRRQPLPNIQDEKTSNKIRKMKKKDKNKSTSQSALVSNDELDGTDGKTTKTNGRDSPGRPFNDTRIHPDNIHTDGVHISTSLTSPLPISTHFHTDSTSSLNNSGSVPRKLPPLKSKLSPLDDNNRPLPTPNSTPR